MSEGILSITLQRRWRGKRNCHGFVKSTPFAAWTDLGYIGRMMTKCWALAALFLVSIPVARADQIVLQNGDRVSGSVVSMTPDTIILQSDLLGQLKLPRNKISAINLGSSIVMALPAPVTTNPLPPLASQPTAVGTNVFEQLGANTNLVRQIRQQFLADAGPQANNKFDELMGGLATGKMDMAGLRAEAKNAADQLRAMKKDMGGESSETLDAYLNVLDSFLAQSATASSPTPTPTPATNAPQGTIIIR
jgi:hypothetical protein